jgi:hypothetical protein
MDTFNKTIREFKRFLHKHNLHLRCYSRTGGGHFRLTIVSNTGRVLTYIMAATSSDIRAKLNRERDVLRYFTEG